MKGGIERAEAARKIEHDPVQIAPHVYRVLLENDRVRVLQIHVKPGEKVPMHSHPAHVIYAISSSKVKFSYPDGRSEIVEMRAGETIWSNPLPHAAENVGTDDIHVLNIELNA